MMSKKSTLRFVGDIMLGGSVLTKIQEFGPTFPFEKFIGKTEPADIFFGNLECALFAGDSPPRLNKILLHSTPAATSGLVKSSINIVSLANNHAFDYGNASFKKAQRYLEANGISCVGGGDNISSATRPVILERNGLRFAFLAYCAREASCEEFADDSNPGVALLDPDTIQENIEAARERSDFVIVSLHFGLEFSDYPTSENVRVARKIIEYGATVVVGSHAHVMQGFEFYEKGLILYDLGSFVFGDIVITSPIEYEYHLRKKKAKQGMMVDCVFGEEGIIDHELIPIHINSDFQATLLHGKEREAVVKRFTRQSKLIANNSYLAYLKLHRYKNKTLKYVRSWAALRKLEDLVRR
jgi:poly-gamma-glutamate synthesis protein (capsule biosynthesis protein)